MLKHLVYPMAADRGDIRLEGHTGDVSEGGVVKRMVRAPDPGKTYRVRSEPCLKKPSRPKAPRRAVRSAEGQQGGQAGWADRPRTLIPEGSNTSGGLLGGDGET